MNIQKMAFGVVVVLALAFAADAMMQNAAIKVITVAFVIALLTLSVTWMLIYGSFQVVGVSLAFIGHSIGMLGDKLADVSYQRRQRMSATRRSATRVPGWSEFDTTTVEPEMPRLLQDTLK